MIKNQWYVIAESKEVKPGQKKGLRRIGKALLMWRNTEGVLSVMLDLCPHRGAALSAGKIQGDCIECPFHGFQYDVAGQGQLIPANGRNTAVPKVFHVQTYTVREAHGFIWLWIGDPQESYPPLPYFEDLDDSFIYATIAVQWHSHYTRSIENQLDVSHIPFIHKSTIGRGHRTLVNGPYVTLEDDTISVWVDNQKDEGASPIKPTKMPEPQRPPQLIFKFPNVWQNRIADNFRIVAAFAPIDDENTMVYVRTYQRTKAQNVFRRALLALTAQSNRIILREDQRVVQTQQPKIAGLEIGERFIPGDRPIALFLTHRRNLIRAAEANTSAMQGATAVAEADQIVDWSTTKEGEIHPTVPYDYNFRQN